MIKLLAAGVPVYFENKVEPALGTPQGS